MASHTHYRCLDELVYLLGPEAVFPNRPAYFGQDSGSVFTVSSDTVAIRVPTSYAHALARFALGTSDHCTRRTRAHLHQLSAAVRDGTPVPVALCIESFTVLAAESYLGRTPSDERIVTGELVVAAYELTSLVQQPQIR